MNLSSGVERAKTRKSREIRENISILATFGMSYGYSLVPTLTSDLRECYEPRSDSCELIYSYTIPPTNYLNFFPSSTVKFS